MVGEEFAHFGMGAHEVAEVGEVGALRLQQLDDLDGLFQSEVGEVLFAAECIQDKDLQALQLLN